MGYNDLLSLVLVVDARLRVSVFVREEKSGYTHPLRLPESVCELPPHLVLSVSPVDSLLPLGKDLHADVRDDEERKRERMEESVAESARQSCLVTDSLAAAAPPATLVLLVVDTTTTTGPEWREESCL